MNRFLMDETRNLTIKNNREKPPSKYKTEADYQNSFADIIAFQKKYTAKEKKEINFIIYHDENNDGVMSAYIVWTFLTGNGKNSLGEKVVWLPLKPSFSENTDKRIIRQISAMAGKSVIVLDLSYNRKTLDAIRQVAKSLIVIDDHQFTTEMGKGVFVGENHSASAYTYKFFYPEKNISKIVQYIDDSDRKLFLPFIPYSNLFALAIGFRFVHNVFRMAGQKLFETLHRLLESDNPNFLIFIGKYYDEVRENIKNQIAQNARLAIFASKYRIAVLNFNAPSLTKPIGRQINTNFAERIDFAVLWGYEYSLNPPAYNITLIDDHRQKKYNMAKIAKEMAKIGKHPLGSGGTAHVSHFYSLKDPSHYIKLIER